ncbi:peptide chain release factor N(5)-glutamine methyltransferase [Galbibacter sp. PAP.153]|uniref:peptide chain release factor N(5)-glutamine methyltransferase n=1 Tax=Galbibacter sp. PAP.153 TaxID=3104623 RepID=UPI0030083535
MQETKNTQLKAIKEQFKNELKEIYPVEEIQTFFNWLCESFLGYKPYQITQNSDDYLEGRVKNQFLLALKELKEEKPIQYILGKAYFYGLEFEVNKHTLIPRPETEELVDWIIKETSKEKSRHILDIGTGSGCIPITLAKHLPKAKVFSVDISGEAIKTAQKNALNNEVEIKFREKDILHTESLSELFKEEIKFDVIVSNPPYVRLLEKKEIKNNVLRHEPESALFVDNENPLIFYKKITQLATQNLKKGGKLYFEINQYLGTEMVQLMEMNGFYDVELKKDLFGNDRMLKAVK